MDYVFPAVVYKDQEEDGFVGTFDDIEIYFQGDTIENAFFAASKYLKDYCKYSHKLYGEVPERPRDYFESVKNHPDAIVLLVHAEVKGLTKNKDESILF